VAVASPTQKSVTILGKTLSTKGKEGGAPGQPALCEYIPANETFDNWTLMFALRFTPGDKLDPKASAILTAEKVKSLRASSKDPVANAAVFESKDGKSVNVDFLTSSAKPEVFEHNVFRYFKVPGGMYSYQIARRIYGTPSNQDDIGKFIKDIPAQRERIFKELNRPDLPR
jgi:hypothetical protein